MTMTFDSTEAANRVAAETYAALEEGGRYHQELNDLITRIMVDAMQSIGVPEGDPRTGGGFDFAATELFDADSINYSQVAQEIVEHTYKATRAYFERAPEPVLH